MELKSNKKKKGKRKVGEEEKIRSKANRNSIVQIRCITLKRTSNTF
jgi:hypothetical protein